MIDFTEKTSSSLVSRVEACEKIELILDFVDLETVEDANDESVIRKLLPVEIGDSQPGMSLKSTNGYSDPLDDAISLFVKFQLFFLP